MAFAAYAKGAVEYEVGGEGSGLVLVHGVGGDAERTFGAFTPALTATRTVVRPNLSGSGKTTDDGEPLTLDLLATQVMAATRDVTEEPVDLLGFSLGATVALVVAATQPDAVRRLILIGGTAHTLSPRDKLAFGLWRQLIHRDLDLFKRFATLQIFSPAMLDSFGHEALEASLQQDWPPGIDRQVELSALLDVRELLPQIKASALVIGFAEDQALPLGHSRELHARISGSRLEELPGGHMDWTIAPEAVISLVQDHLLAP
jgi:pimeloyl-ACP methyl ester carboxylesterase